MCSNITKLLRVRVAGLCFSRRFRLRSLREIYIIYKARNGRRVPFQMFARVWVSTMSTGLAHFTLGLQSKVHDFATV